MEKIINVQVCLFFVCFPLIMQHINFSVFVIARQVTDAQTDAAAVKKKKKSKKGSSTTKTVCFS